MRVFVRILSKFIAITYKAAGCYIECRALHLIEQVWSHDFAGSTHDLVHTLVNHLRLVNCNASLLIDSVLKLVLGLVV